MNVLVSSHLVEESLSLEGIRRLVFALCETIGLSGEEEISVVLTDDEKIRSLNSTYRGIDRSTDVLSFSMQEGVGPATSLLGDVVLSMETLARQAEEKQWSLAEEAGFLLLHGILHLLGYDHIEEDEALEMEARSEAVWSEVRSLVPGFFDVS